MVYHSGLLFSTPIKVGRSTLDGGYQHVLSVVNFGEVLGDFSGLSMRKAIEMLSEALVELAFSFTNVHKRTFGAENCVDDTFAFAGETFPDSVFP